MVKHFLETIIAETTMILGNEGNAPTKRELNYILGPGAAFKTANQIRFSPKILNAATDYLLHKGYLKESDTVYDPFCGNGTVLYGLASYYPEVFGQLHGSDSRDKAVRVANDNLSLTDKSKLVELIESEENQKSVVKFLAKRERHLTKLKYLLDVYERIDMKPTPFEIFQANVLVENFAEGNLEPGSVDAVLTDPPYNMACPWYAPNGSHTIPDQTLGEPLKNISKYVAEDGKIILILDKGATPELNGFELLDKKELEGTHLDREVFVLNNSKH